MPNLSLRATVPVALILAIALLLQPASASAQGRTQRISKKLLEKAEDMIKDIDEAKDQVNKAMQKYNQIFSRNKVKDRQKAFRDLNKELNKTEDRAEDVRKRSEDMQKEADKFFAEWSRGLTNIRDDELRALSHTTMTENRDRYGEIIESGVRASNLYNSFVTDMENQTAYLALDVSDAAIDRLRATQEATQEKVSELFATVDEMTRATKDYIDSMK
jgi:hypothetical protein